MQTDYLHTKQPKDLLEDLKHTSEFETLFVLL